MSSDDSTPKRSDISSDTGSNTDSKTESMPSHEPAKLRSRILAMVYDALIILFITTIAVIVIQGVLVGSRELPADHILIMLLKPFWFVPGFFYLGYHWTKCGQTPSMKIWKIKLLNQQGQLLSWPNALLRYLTAFMGLGIILALFNKRRLSLQDILSKTSVVKTAD